MYCPTCRSEYVDGISSCPVCGGSLVAEEPVGDPEIGTLQPTVVLETTDATKLAVAKSLLTAEGIEFAVYGEDVQDLFGVGRFPSGTNLFMGPMRLVVAPDDAEIASECLSAQTALESDDDDDDPSSWRLAKPAAKAATGVYLVYVAISLGLAVLAVLGSALLSGE